MMQVVRHKEQQFSVGDTIRVHQLLDNTRTQAFEGMVIAVKNQGQNRSFTVRRLGANNIGVERIFPLYSPLIQKVEVVAKGAPHRAKLYYLRAKPAREMIEIRKRYTRRESAKLSSKKKTKASKTKKV